MRIPLGFWDIREVIKEGSPEKIHKVSEQITRGILDRFEEIRMVLKETKLGLDPPTE